MLKKNNIVFVFIIFATLTAFASELFKVFELNKIPDIALIFSAVILIFSGVLLFPKRVLYSVIPIIVIYSTVFLYNIYNGRLLVGQSGIIGLTVVTVVFTLLLSLDRSEDQVNTLGKQISILFVIHILYIFLELIVLMLYGYEFMRGIIPTYRNLSGQPIYALLGMDSLGGANALMVGPQVASQLLVLSIFWFAPIYKKNMFPLKYVSNKFIWILSIVLYPFCMTGTSLLMFFILLLVVLFLYPNKITKRGFQYIKLFLILAFTIGLWTGNLFDILLYRLSGNDLQNGGKLISYYLDTFLDPVIAFKELPLENMLFGMQGDRSLLKHTDFGFAAIIWSGGLLLASVTLCSFFVVLIKVYRAVKNNLFYNTQDYNWRILAVASATGSIGWFVSLAHYTVATETGGKHFFAFMIAVAIVSMMRINSEKKHQ